MQFLKYIAALIEFIQLAEQVMPESGKGREKLVMVKEWLQAAAGDVTDIWPLAEKFIGATVKLYNALGLFKKG